MAELTGAQIVSLIVVEWTAIIVVAIWFMRGVRTYGFFRTPFRNHNKGDTAQGTHPDAQHVSSSSARSTEDAVR